MKKLASTLIKFYRVCFSPFFGQHCRFHPTCSVYAHQAIHYYGLPLGVIKSVGRLLRCHPFAKGGIDEVGQSPNIFN
jgi:putative membrane protein insertion efficiency factor